MIYLLIEVSDVTKVSSPRDRECCEQNRRYKVDNGQSTAYLTAAVLPLPLLFHGRQREIQSTVCLSLGGCKGPEYCLSPFCANMSGLTVCEVSQIVIKEGRL